MAKEKQYRLRMDERTAEDLKYIKENTGYPVAFILRETIHNIANQIRVSNEELKEYDILRELHSGKKTIRHYDIY